MILSQVTPTGTSYPNSTDIDTTTTPPFTCAPCTVSVTETLLTFPVPVNLTLSTATATVIPYITEYPDGTNVTSYSTFSAYTENATSNNNFTTPTTTPLTWKTLGFTLTYPTSYIAYPSPEAGINNVFAVNGTSYCYAENFTVVPNIPTASILFSYNATIFGLPAATSATATDNSGSQLSTTSEASSEPTSLSSAAVNSAYASLTSSLLSFLDGLPQLSSIVSTNPASCSQIVGGFTNLASAVTSFTLNTVPTATVVHTSVAVLTQTGQAVFTTATSSPDNGGGNGNGNGNSGQSSAGGGGDNSGGGGNGNSGSGSSGGGSNNSGGSGSGNSGGGSSGSGSSGNSGSGSSGNSGSGSSGSGSSGNSGNGSGGSGSSGNSGSGSGGSGSNGNSGENGGIGAVVGGAAASYAATAVVTPPPSMGGSGQYITVGGSSFVVSAETGNAGGGIVIGGGYATLGPNSGIAINGVPISYEVSGGTTALVVGGSTIPMSVATAIDGVEGILTFGGQTITESNGEYIIGGTTLTPGGQIVVGGTTISLAPGGSVAVVNGQTETLASTTVSGNTGGAIMSGIGVTGSSSAQSTSTHKAAAPTLVASGCLVAAIAGVVGALGMAM